MGKIRRGGYIFVSWKSDHPPRHVHVYREGRLIVKWDLDNDRPMKGSASPAHSRSHPRARGGGQVVKLRGVRINARRKAFEVRTSSRRLLMPFGKVEPRPTPDDPVVRAFVDRELGSEGFGFVLRSGREGTVHVEQVLEYNRDPGHLRDQLLYALTLEAQKRVKASALSRRELIRRLGTSATQFYRLLDQTNYRKSVDQLLLLLQLLDCDVRLVVRSRTA